MRYRTLVRSAALALLAIALLPATYPGQAPPVQAPPVHAPGAAKGQERHPEIRAAMRALQNAKRELEKGAHDFGGHRVKALEHVNQALAECREALTYDKK